MNLPPDMRYIADLSMLVHAERFTLQVDRAACPGLAG